MECGPRVPDTPGHACARLAIRTHLEATAERVAEHSFRDVLPLESQATEQFVDYHNIVGVFNEGAPYRICFGAHWDTRARADEEADSTRARRPGPGANDGGSGVAVLLELATLFAEIPPAVGVDLIFFDAEDNGLAGDPYSWALGSARFVRDHPTYRPAFVVIVDMVGREGSRVPREPNSIAGAAPLVQAIWNQAAKLELTTVADSVGPPVFDDHIAFLNAGIPAAVLIDLADPRWHTLDDRPEYCSPHSLGEIGSLLLALVAQAERTIAGS